MKKFAKYAAALILLCMSVQLAAAAETEAAYEAGNGTIEVKNKDNVYEDGKYKIVQSFTYNKRNTDSYGLEVRDAYLANSAGKKVLTYSNQEILKSGGEHTIKYSVDFSSLPSDTYTLYFRVFSGYYGKSWNFKRNVVHNAGKVSYSSAKYQSDTNGERFLNVTFSVSSLKGYTPKFEVYNSAGKQIYSRTCYSKVPSDNTNYSCAWDFYTNSGMKAQDGEYTFKLTCNGKSTSKKLNVKVQ